MAALKVEVKATELEPVKTLIDDIENLTYA